MPDEQRIIEDEKEKGTKKGEEKEKKAARKKNLSPERTKKSIVSRN
ncbi:MAG: hypothetical protein LBG31_02370 [Prevotellaceae bacterium]|jgi:hypothetical protein|nr:hypothetical protein [Prevotellaceae bacterium]